MTYKIKGWLIWLIVFLSFGIVTSVSLISEMRNSESFNFEFVDYAIQIIAQFLFMPIFTLPFLFYPKIEREVIKTINKSNLWIRCGTFLSFSVLLQLTYSFIFNFSFDSLINWTNFISLMSSTIIYLLVLFNKKESRDETFL